MSATRRFPVHTWMISAAANLVILAVYLTVSLTVARGLWRSGQTHRDNPLGWATAAIFLTCAVHHGNHPVHMLLPAAGVEVDLGLAMRAAFAEWHVAYWDVVTAVVGWWYLSLRTRFPALVHGAAIFEDVRERQRQALEIQDNVVQGLATAKLSLETDHHQQGLDAVEESLRASRRIITDLLGEEDAQTALGPGDFRRARAARR